MKKLLVVLLALAMVFAFAACGGSSEPAAEEPAAEALDLNSMTVDELIAAAKEEGDVQSVGMPDEWAD